MTEPGFSANLKLLRSSMKRHGEKITFLTHTLSLLLVAANLLYVLSYSVELSHLCRELSHDGAAAVFSGEALQRGPVIGAQERVGSFPSGHACHPCSLAKFLSWASLSSSPFNLACGSRLARPALLSASLPGNEINISQRAPPPAPARG